MLDAGRSMWPTCTNSCSCAWPHEKAPTQEQETTMTEIGVEGEARILRPDSPEWDDARRVWNLAVDQRPEAIVAAESASDVMGAVRYASENGLQVAVQGTGHGAASLGPLHGTLLLRTGGMQGVQIDAAARLARVEAGTIWLDVVKAAAEHGLAPLSGSSPDVGVAGYTLGGGLSFLGRKHGLAAHALVAAEVVTADGRLLRADEDSNSELLWALRGGGGSFGALTALEVRLFPVEEVYAGILWFPLERASEVLHAWAELTRGGLPEELTTIGRVLQLPPLEEIPEPVRGKSFVVVEAIDCGEPALAHEALAPLRALEPAMDTLRPTPMPELGALHMDPDHPVPGVGDGLMLESLPVEAVDELVRVAGPGSRSPLLSLEVRHLGGALGRPRPEHAALAAVEAGYALYGVGIAVTPELGAACSAHLDAVKERLSPWTARQMVPNFAETKRDPASFWGDDAYERLCRVKQDVDPGDLFRANHPVVTTRETA
jgi:FAD/FMN-containing dehydrogenase